MAEKLTARERVSRFLVASSAREDTHLAPAVRPVVVRAGDLEAILRECLEPFDVDADERVPARSAGGSP